MELIDLGHLGDLVRIVAVVRERVMRIGDADLRIRAVAGFARQLKRDDARDVALQRQQLQVEHQPGVVGVGGRHAERPIEIGQRILLGGRFGLLNAPLDVADRFQVLVDAVAIARAERVLQPREFFGHGIEQARPLLRARRGARPVPPSSPNRFSNTIRGWASAGSGVVGDDQERLF